MCTALSVLDAKPVTVCVSAVYAQNDLAATDLQGMIDKIETLPKDAIALTGNALPAGDSGADEA